MKLNSLCHLMGAGLLAVLPLYAQDTHERPTMELTTLGPFGIRGNGGSPDYSDCPEQHDEETGKPVLWEVGCINATTGGWLSCETFLRTYYGKPYDMSSLSEIHEWSGGHDHKEAGDDP